MAAVAGGTISCTIANVDLWAGALSGRKSTSLDSFMPNLLDPLEKLSQEISVVDPVIM